ncbi:hypothetical protein AV530_016304 [Patagioenas fasciata monilis]|uniref:Uncharacterized protein n=1 Tax=Patagioenas fasciata monilis TaxID=372326 RepID=A0A1V4JWR7_PATFA|nr:hypothetical protein AV530_016304 [Patagioenas fasciata monilis]
MVTASCFQSKGLPPESVTFVEDKTQEATAKWRAATPSKDCEASGIILQVCRGKLAKSSDYPAWTGNLRKHVYNPDLHPARLSAAPQTGQRENREHTNDESSVFVTKSFRHFGGGWMNKLSPEQSSLAAGRNSK